MNTVTHNSRALDRGEAAVCRALWDGSARDRHRLLLDRDVAGSREEVTGLDTLGGDRGRV